MSQKLYQVRVEDRSGEVIAVGPKMLKPYAEALLAAIKDAVKVGAEKTWGNPHLVICL